MKTHYRYGKAVFLLLRCNLSLAIAFSGLAGFVLCAHSFRIASIFSFIGVFLLSGAASALNQYQERHWDGLMNRTSARPLPLKRIRTRQALVIALIAVVAGASILFFGCTLMSALLGVLNLVLYNAIYTPLKRKSRYAVFIGAVTGAIPPMIGWAAAGGTLSNPFILAVALFMYIWQIPHFLLLQLRFGKEYAAAGFPLFLVTTDEKRARSVFFIWLAGTSVCTLLFPFFRIISGTATTAVLLFLNAVVISIFYKNLFLKKEPLNFDSAFRSIYLYQIGIFVILMGNLYAM